MVKDLGFGLVPDDQIDWARVRKVYESTPLPVTEIACKFGIPEEKLLKRIETHKWSAPPAATADWALIRTAFETTTEPLTSMVARFGAPRNDIVKRATTEAWTDPRKTGCEVVASLTALQTRFVDEYLRDLHVARAARRAGISAPTGQAYLKDPAVTEAIADAIAERAVNVQVDAGRVVQELGSLAFANIADYVSWDDKGKVRVKPSNELTRAQTAGIIGIEESKTGLRVKFDKSVALNALAKHLGLFDGHEDSKTQVAIMISQTDADL